MSKTIESYVPNPPDDEYEDGEYEYEYAEGYADDEVLPEEQPTGLFSTPARTATVIGSLLLLVTMMAVVVWILGTRPSEEFVPGINSGNAIPVSLITNPNLGGQGEAPQKGKVAPNFEWADASTGQPMQLSSLKGKPVFVNFWGTWCPPCRAEMPEMQRLYNTYKGQMEFVGVSMAPRDNVNLVKGFVNSAEHFYTWRFVQDDSYEVAQRYQVQAVPSSYFIGADGTIRAVHIGGMNGAQMEAYLQQIK